MSLASTAPDGPVLDALLPDGPARAAFAALRRDWHARIAPIDTAERAVADSVAALAWRRLRLDAVEERLMGALLEARPLEGWPSLATLQRARHRLEADRRMLGYEMEELRYGRPQPLPVPGLNPDRLEWLARKLRDGTLRGPAARSPEARTADPAPRPAAEAGASRPTASGRSAAGPAARSPVAGPSGAGPVARSPVAGPSAAGPANGPRPPAPGPGPGPSGAGPAVDGPFAAAAASAAVGPAAAAAAPVGAGLSRFAAAAPSDPLAAACPWPARRRTDWLGSASTYALAVGAMAGASGAGGSGRGAMSGGSGAGGSG